MTKRNLFAELTEGFGALAEARAGKRTLRTHTVETAPAPEVKGPEIAAMRERLRLSRPVYAGVLGIKNRTLENWEQGRAKPNPQAVMLMKLVDHFPDTIDRLGAMGAPVIQSVKVMAVGAAKTKASTASGKKEGRSIVDDMVSARGRSKERKVHRTANAK